MHSCVLSTLLLLIWGVPPCLAESTATSEWNISADKISRLKNPERIIAEGNIVLEKRRKILPSATEDTPKLSDWAELLEEKSTPVSTTPDSLETQQEPRYKTETIIRADWITYYVETQTIEAKGNVIVDSGDDKLMASDGRVNLTQETGSFNNSVIVRKDNELHLEGKTIEKTGVESYRIEDGWVITCKIEKGETPPWSFSSSEATVKLGGYAVLKNAKFNIQNIPVFYLPYMIVPVKNQRQTGFLFPEFSNSSRDGAGLNVPFFINLSDSTDITLYPEYYSKRGVMPGADFRYVVDESSKGKFTGSYLDDDLSDPENTEYYADTGFSHTNNDRYWIRGKADHDFGNDWISRLDVDIVSDEDYLEEFNSGITGFKDTQESYLETFGRGFENQSDDLRTNSLKFLKSWSGSSLNIDFLAINDAATGDRNPTPLWKLPSVDYTGTKPFMESGFTFEWDADYVNYWREEGIGGHRVDLFPRLSTPVNLGPYLESRAELGGRGTFYSVETYGESTWSDDDNPSRFLPIFETEVATTLERNFSLASASYSHLTHSVRPFIEYNYIPEEDQSDLPVFDSIDRIDETNAFTYGVDSFFTLYEDDEISSRYGYVRMEQSYDLRNEASDEPFSPVTLKLGWNPLKRLSIAYKTLIPVEDDDNTTHGLETIFSNSRGDNVSFDYRYNEDEDIEQINGNLNVWILPEVAAALDFEHSIAESETNEATFSLTYFAQCWSVELQTQHTPTDERVMLVFNLANIGSSLGLGL